MRWIGALTMLASMIFPLRAVKPVCCNLPLNAALMSPISSFSLSRSHHIPRLSWRPASCRCVPVTRSARRWAGPALGPPAPRRAGCTTATIAAAGSSVASATPGCRLPPVSRRSWPSITTAIAAKSMCRDSSSSGSLNRWRLTSC